MKKLISVLFLILIFSNVCYATNVSFSDVDSSHWAYNDIVSMSGKGYLKGYEDGTFKPNKEVTREEFAQMVYNTLSSILTRETVANKLDDVPHDKWSYNAVQFIGESIKETSDGYTYFYPTRPIQRQEVAKVLSDCFGLEVSVETLDIPEAMVQKGMDEKILYVLNNKLNVNDTDKIDLKYMEAVYNMYSSELMKGISDKEFAPTNSLTRAQAATLLLRALNMYKGVEKPQVDEGKDLDLSFLKMEPENTNIVYSPLSIKYALKMLTEGANGKTKEEIDNLVAKYNLTKYENVEDVLSLANSVYIRDTYKDYVKADFINTVKEKYSAEINYDSFANAKNINSWVSNKTFNIINNMLEDSQVNNPDSRMILINALAINMKWTNNFEKDNTVKRMFNNVKVDTMMKKARGSSESFYKDDDVTVLTMDYKEQDLEFVAIMPEKEKLANYINNFSMEQYNELLSKLTKASDTPAGLEIYIPKFTFEHSIKVKDELKELGMKLAFTDDADFSNMTTSVEGLHVDDVIHKAKIEFDEEGTKAAAATAVIMFRNTAIAINELQPIVIRIDKPFMFLIRDKNTGEIWFVGDVYNP